MHLPIFLFFFFLSPLFCTLKSLGPDASKQCQLLKLYQRLKSLSGTPVTSSERIEGGKAIPTNHQRVHSAGRLWHYFSVLWPALKCLCSTQSLGQGRSLSRVTERHWFSGGIVWPSLFQSHLADTWGNYVGHTLHGLIKYSAWRDLGNTKRKALVSIPFPKKSNFVNPNI